MIIYPDPFSTDFSKVVWYVPYDGGQSDLPVDFYPNGRFVMFYSRFLQHLLSLCTDQTDIIMRTITGGV